VDAGRFILFENAGEKVELKALSEDTVMLVLSGQPLHEPIAHRWPFVMNTKEELDQAFRDFRNGKF
jgi:redox-sensitive bicupin YhaK (pirin superfamily)